MFSLNNTTAYVVFRVILLLLTSKMTGKHADFMVISSARARDKEIAEAFCDQLIAMDTEEPLNGGVISSDQ